MRLGTTALFGAFAMALAVQPAAAVTITVEPGSNLAFFDYEVDVASRTIDIYETFGAATAGSVVLKFTDWTFGSASWVVNKYVTNDTGGAFASFSHELLQADKSGSEDNDGLSFAQFGAPLRPRTSDSFADVFADELAGRDYLLFSNGLIDIGAVAKFSFGLTNKRATDDTRVFFLRQSEFLSAVPEPATWAVMIVGFGLVGVAMRRRRRFTSISA